MGLRVDHHRRGRGNVWALYDDGSSVIRLSRTGTKATEKLGGGTVVDAAKAEGYLRVAMDSIGGVWKLDRDASVRDQIATGAGPWGDGRGRWLSLISNARLEPSAGSIRGRMLCARPKPATARSASPVTDGRLWAVSSCRRPRACGHRGGACRHRCTSEDVGVTDPAAVADQLALAFAHSLGVGLMRYRTAVDGIAEIVPELAAGDPRYLVISAPVHVRDPPRLSLLLPR